MAAPSLVVTRALCDEHILTCLIFSSCLLHSLPMYQFNMRGYWLLGFFPLPGQQKRQFSHNKIFISSSVLIPEQFLITRDLWWQLVSLSSDLNFSFLVSYFKKAFYHTLSNKNIFIIWGASITCLGKRAQRLKAFIVQQMLLLYYRKDCE